MSFSQKGGAEIKNMMNSLQGSLGNWCAGLKTTISNHLIDVSGFQSPWLCIFLVFLVIYVVYNYWN